MAWPGHSPEASSQPAARGQEGHRLQRGPGCGWHMGAVESGGSRWTLPKWGQLVSWTPNEPGTLVFTSLCNPLLLTVHIQTCFYEQKTAKVRDVPSKTGL